MNIAVHIEPANGAPPEVEYKWDADTDTAVPPARRGLADKALPPVRLCVTPECL